MAEGFRFIYLAFRLAHGLVRCNMNAGIHAHVSFRDVKIKTPERFMTGGCEWRHAPEACAEDLGDLRKVSELSFCLRRRRLTFGLAEALRWVPRAVGGRWKSQQRKNVYLSPYVEKPFDSKVIKSFVPELRSRKVFRISGFLYSIYICALCTWTFCVPVWICLFHISVSWVCYIYIYIYIYKLDLALNNPQWFIGHKPNQTSNSHLTFICSYCYN